MLVLLLPLSAHAGEMSGTILDPQDLPVAGARVRMTCGGRARSASTDAHGRFMFSNVADSDGCSIDVSLRGFAPVHEIVRHDAAPVVVRLRVAAVKEVVDVVGRVEPTARPSPFSVSLADDDFRTVANNTADLIRYTRLLAGATTLPSVVYVDGLPSAGLPPIETVARISVNADPFSAEYADGDVSTIHITTKSPARTFRFFSGSELPGIGGRDVLGSNARPESASGSFGLRGPVFHLPLTFSFSANAAHSSTPSSVQAVLPATMPPASVADVMSENRSGAAAVDLHYSPASTSRAHVTYRQAVSTGSNVGVGGLALPESGLATSFQSRDVRATMSRAAQRLLYEGGVVATVTDSSTRANADTLGLSVVGSFQSGGASSIAADSRRVQWTVKQVLRSTASRPWSAGILLSGSDHLTQQTPNAAGLMQFENIEAYTEALNGRPTGTLFLTRGSGTIAYAPMTASPFLQKTLARTSHLEASAGLRADYQTGFGTLISPRVSLAAALGRFNIAAGAGLFARNVPDYVVTSTMMNDGQHFRRFIATGVSLDGLADAALSEQPSIRSRLAPDLARPREWMERFSIERAFGRFVPAFEYTWTRDRHLLGSERTADQRGWVDTVDANRAADRHRLRAQARYGWSRHQLSANYEWMHARDNSDGPFSFPERAGNLTAEWARSAGLAPHNVSVVGSFALPGAVSVNVSDSWNSGSPYNITTALGDAGNGLYVDRGGRARNSGDGPGYQPAVVVRLSPGGRPEGGLARPSAPESRSPGEQHPRQQELHQRGVGCRLRLVRPAARGISGAVGEGVCQCGLTNLTAEMTETTETGCCRRTRCARWSTRDPSWGWCVASCCRQRR